MYVFECLVSVTVLCSRMAWLIFLRNILQINTSPVVHTNWLFIHCLLPADIWCIAMQSERRTETFTERAFSCYGYIFVQFIYIYIFLDVVYLDIVIFVYLFNIFFYSSSQSAKNFPRMNARKMESIYAPNLQLVLKYFLILCMQFEMLFNVTLL